MTITKTPYAVLLCRASDTPEIVRSTFLTITRVQHPDINEGVPGPDFENALRAYNLIKTEEKARRWYAKQILLSKLCTTCKGYGTVGSRYAGSKVKICDKCAGNGRRAS